MTELKFNLTNQQIKKLANAYKNKSEVKLKLNNNMIMANGGVPLLQTNTEIKKLNDNKNHCITISSARVTKGGFLPLLAAIPAIADRSIKEGMPMAEVEKMTGSGLWLNPSGGYGLVLKKIITI